MRNQNHTAIPPPHQRHGATWVRGEALEQLARATTIISQDTETLQVTRHPGGTTLTALPQAVLRPIEIVGVHAQSPSGPTAVAVYTGSLYGGPGGYDDAPTATGMTIRANQLAPGEVLASGRRFMAARVDRGTWQKADGTTKTETYYRIDVPRWL